jgi:hypothetical protein
MGDQEGRDMTITPIDELPRQPPQAGRIRIGEQVKSRKSDAMFPTSLDHFRFTSPDRELVEWCAETFGGTVKPFGTSSSGDRWMVDSEVTELEVIVAGYTMSYELWNPHLERRCGGATPQPSCEISQDTPDGSDRIVVPCICAHKGLDDYTRECDKILRLPVVFEHGPSVGSWRFDTRSDHSQKEIRGYFDMVAELAGVIRHRATMKLNERRMPTERGKPNKVYKVVTLDYRGGIESLVAGDARLVQLPAPSSPTVAALGAGASSVTRPSSTPEAGEPMAGEAGDEDQSPPVGPSPASPPTIGRTRMPEGDLYKLLDDDIVDAEVVEDDEARKWLDELPQNKRNAVLRRAREVARAHGEPEPTVAAAIPDHILQQIKEQVEAGDDARVRTSSD